MSGDVYDIKRRYQQTKVVAAAVSPLRVRLGERELQTLELLAAEVGFDARGAKTFLDLGCGDRYLCPTVEARGACYLSFDYDLLDFERDIFPLADESIDVAVSLAVLEHLHDPSIFLGEILRVLRPGGLIYLSTPNFQYDWKNFYNDPTHVKPYTPSGLEHTLRLCGFASVATFPGLRCKPLRWYRGENRFWKARYLLPFRGDARWAPGFLKGHARSVFALGCKPAG
jgi:SAM-dependent methyltransferase